MSPSALPLAVGDALADPSQLLAAQAPALLLQYLAAA